MCKKDTVAKWLALVTSQNEVSCLNLAESRIQVIHVPMWHFIAQSLSLSHFYHLETIFDNKGTVQQADLN